MFPLSEDSLIALGLAIYYLVCAAIFYAAFGRSIRFALFTLLGLLLLVALALLAIAGGDLGILIDPLFRSILGYPLGAILFAFGLAFLARRPSVQARATGAGVGLLVLGMVMPAIVGLGIVIERQTLPDHACATSSIPVQVGDTRLTLPFILNGDLFVAPPYENLRYGPARRAREDVRALCKLTDKGKLPVESDLVWLATISYLPALSMHCASGRGAICDGFSTERHAQVGALQITLPLNYNFTIETDRLDAPPQPGDLRVGDKNNGYVCLERTGETVTRHCRMWRTLGPESAAFIVSNHQAKVTNEALAELLSAELDYLLRVLAVKGR